MTSDRWFKHKLVVAWALTFAASVSAAPLTTEAISPLKRSTKAIDIALAPAGAIPIELDFSEVAPLWNAKSVRLTGMPMPDGDDVTLRLRPVENPVNAIWYYTGEDANGPILEHVAAAPVLLLAGSVEDVPGSTVFLGIADGQAQGWIETAEGLHLLATPPDGGGTLFYRVGKDRGGLDVPAPGVSVDLSRLEKQANPFVPIGDHATVLRELQTPGSEIRERFLEVSGIRRLPQMLDLLTRDEDDVDPEYQLGACCVMPGMCLLLTAEVCSGFCSDAKDTFCGNTWDGPPIDFAAGNLPPCWLGPEVGCGGSWTCFETDPEAEPEDPSFGNWTGACCLSVDGIEEVLQLEACVCAQQGGRFVAPPAICIGEDLAAPEKMPTDNFVSADTIIALDPDICSKPSGACCMEQSILCEDIADPDDPIYDLFLQVTCQFLPQAICEDADILADVFNGTGSPGYFVAECYPCISTLEGDSVCPASMQLETGGVAPPIQLECQEPRIAVDTDWWFLERFDGDASAAGTYVTLLMASINSILERDALVSFQIGDVVLRGEIPHDQYIPGSPDLGGGMDYLLRGACCIEDLNECWERRTEQWCEDQEVVHGNSTTWLGPGSSCWDADGTPCPGNNSTVHDDEDATPFTIADMWGLMNDEWNRIAADPLHPLYEVRDSSNLVLLMSGYPFERPYWALPLTAPDPYVYQEWGIVPQIADAGTTRVMCTDSDSPYAVAAAHGSFPWPGTPFDQGNANWDLVAATRAMVLAFGVDPTNAYGLDDCIGPPCLDVSLTSDCLHSYYYAGLRDFAITPQNAVSMPPTLMSYCMTCPGESANMQLRFRSEIAARIYARFATMTCESGVGSLDAQAPTAPYAVDDFYIQAAAAVHYLDAVANDLAPGCTDQNVFDPSTWDPDTFDPNTDPWPEFPLFLSRIEPDAPDLDPQVSPWWSYPQTALPATTVMGGTIDIVPDPNNPGQLVVEYIPPPEFCGIDFFYYEVSTDPPFVPDPDSPDPDNPDPLWLPETDTGLVRITESVCAGGTRSIVDLPNYPPQSVTEPTIPPTPPVAGAPDVIALDGFSVASQLNSLSWTAVELDLIDPLSTAPNEAFWRIWGVREAGASLYDDCSDGSPCAIFYDAHPFGGPGECGPVQPFVWAGEDPVGPIDGDCDAPDNFYLPSEGELLIQCLEESDDLPGVDAEWIAGNFCVDVDTISAEGACCLDGLCVITTPYDCAAMGWAWEWVAPDPLTCPGLSNPNYRWEWTYDTSRAGFFMGNGTTCDDRDWCRRTAPCCYERPDDAGPACALLTCEECLELGGKMLTWGRENVHGVMDFFDGTQWCSADPDWLYVDGPPQPLWDSPCEYPVCDLDFTNYPRGAPVVIEPPDPSQTIGACCVLALDQATAGAQLQYCTNLSRLDCEELAGHPTVVSTSWSIRGRCEDVPCTPLGACCATNLEPLEVVCTDGVSFEDCLAIWNEGTDTIAFTPHATCADLPCDADAIGGCCLPQTGVCCENFTREVCDLISGVFLGNGADCSTCGQADSQGVCSVDYAGIGVCTADVSQSLCELSLLGTWYADVQTCNESIPDVGSGMGGPLGACCYEFECISAVAENDCILSGGFPILKSHNPYHPFCAQQGNEPDPLGACCYDNDRYGEVCVDLTQAQCTSLAGTWCSSGLCGDDCPGDPGWEGCAPLDFCAPGRCEVTWQRDTNDDDCPDAIYTNTFIAANPERCTSRDGVWLGQVTRGALPPRTAGDLDGDGRVGTSDLLILLRSWGYPDPTADLDGSGLVDAGDLHRMLLLWKP